MPETFAAGQRWISTPEPDLGLGIILEAANRRVVIAFPAAEEERTYAADRAPLSRVQFQIGDTIDVPELPPMKVREVQEHNQCLVYFAEDAHGDVHPVPEQILSAQIQLHSARDRLLAGQLDHPKRFALRVSTLEQRNRARASHSRGLLGPRVELLPHQFYIAREVGGRAQPRVLLADEVGLGKTIEAGLILHQQLLDERIKRVVILVPESLSHQWLVEMRRRFNLNFSLFNEARCRDLDPYRDDADTVFFDEDAEKAREQNPFESEQLIIAAIDWLTAHPRRGQQLRDAGWDTLIVDEAHHLQWREDGSSDPGYALLESLCAAIPSVLLLTATPENAGIEGHFARLRLLDPQRYSSLQAFRDEQAQYGVISELIQQLRAGEAGVQAQLADYLDDALLADFVAQPDTHRNAVIEALLDRFGTGRSLFRNTRASVGGFPERALQEHPLAAPDGFPTERRDATLEAQLQPEGLLGDDWTSRDPRVQWLEKFLLNRPDERCLLICADTDTARDLELFIRLRRGIASAVFHEDMSLLERDRAAAYFADADDGAQLLVCSEIGSEGRNFQFAEHLILFDLPLNPDLLEQRIGRLDRIGRRYSVQIHVPFYEHSAQQDLLHWYRDALAIFSEPCTIGSAMMQRFDERLRETLINADAMPQLLSDAAEQAQALRQQLHSGRNQLLELNSCRRDIADALIDSVETEQRGSELAAYLEQLADQFGLEHEDHSDNAIILRPGEHMLSDAFSELPEEGMTGTFDRRRALSREDMAFLTWEHPLLRDAMELIANGDFGSACINTLSVKGLPAGTMLLETFFNPSVQAPAALALDRYLPAHSARLLLDSRGRQLTDKVSHAQLNALCQNVKKSVVPALMRQIREPLTELLNQMESLAATQQDDWRQQALSQYEQARRTERARLQALAERNPAVGEDELEHFDRDTEQGKRHIQALQLSTHALRLAIIS
ncbi:RNA polymerase-associated protein RapA [Spongiibacter tropicus]|uniref:RNA polymerase-associated protein RapA n=1 Tax=Spongiibacter tropicus TaxID=454602 RepID=UPI0035BE5A01